MSLLNRVTVFEVQLREQEKSYRFTNPKTPIDEGHWIFFEVILSNRSSVDEAKIEIWNTELDIKVDDYVRLKSGYEEGSAIIFVGQVQSVERKNKRGTWVTELDCVDVSRSLLKAYKSYTFKKGATWDDIILAMIQDNNAAAGVISNTGKKLEKETTLSDDSTVWDHIKEYADEIGFKFYARGGRIYFVNPAYYVPTGYKLNYKNGLLQKQPNADDSNPDLELLTTIFLPELTPDGILAVIDSKDDPDDYSLYVIEEVKMKCSTGTYNCEIKAIKKKSGVDV